MIIRYFQHLTFSDSPLSAIQGGNLKTQDIRYSQYFKNMTNSGTINSNKY